MGRSDPERDPVADYQPFGDARIKHLEMIQAVISRLGTDGFIVKGWAVTVSGAFFGFAISGSSWELAAGSAIPTIVFWCLDTYFLRSERLFRCLYERVRDTDATVPPFFMGATSPEFYAALPEDVRKHHSWPATWRRRTLLLLYLGLLVFAVVVLVAVLLAGDGSSPQPHHRG